MSRFFHSARPFALAVAVCAVLSSPSVSSAAPQITEPPRPAALPAALLPPDTNVSNSTDAAPAPPAPQPAAPSTYINSDLPEWLRFSGEFRDRLEERTSWGFASGVNDGYDLTRLRLAFDVIPVSWLNIFVQSQDSRAFGMESAHISGSYRDPMDLRQIYLEFRSDHSWIALKVGRQELNLGDQRFVGSGDWGNVGRTFDTARLTLTNKQYGAAVSFLASSVVVANMNGFNWHNPGQNLYGAYSSLTKLVKKATIEPYLLLKTNPLVTAGNGTTGSDYTYTVGARWVGKLPHRFDYKTEMGRQFGHYAAQTIDAWGGYWGVGYTAALPLNPRFYSEFTYGSGTRNPNSGTYGTFDEFYAINFPNYGLTDQIGWRNMKHIRSGAEARPTKKLKVNLDYHYTWLDSAFDNLYNTFGALYVKAPTGGAQSLNVGAEADAFGTYQITRGFSVLAGIGHLFPGAFLRENSGGGSMTYPYVAGTYSLD
jgi:hypothetical protein